MGKSRKCWTDKYWPVWLLAGIIGFGVPEFLALVDRDVETEPLTNWTVRHVGGEGLMTVLLWLILHFGIRYVRKH